MKKFKNKKHIALSLVALVLVMLMTVGVTYSWIDDIKQVEISTDQNGEEAPLKSGVDINSNIEINSTVNTINLGKVLTKNELEYDYIDDQGKEKSHTKYEHNTYNEYRDPDWDDIDTKKGYFYESGDMHLSGCYSDGEKFFFPREGASGYRESNKDDENVNYISFTAKVSSPNANVDFWFDQKPSILNDNNEEISKARFAITVNGKTSVYSDSGSASYWNGSAITTVRGTRKTTAYTYGHGDNTTSSRGDNSNTLFSIKKGDTVLLNIKIWIEPGVSTDLSTINLKLVSSWGKNRVITFRDKTTKANGTSWLNDDPMELIMAIPEAKGSSWEKNKSYWVLSNSNNDYTATIPAIYNNTPVIFLRCRNENDFLNNTNYTGSHQYETDNEYKYKVRAWNAWKTTLPNTYHDEIYQAYGSSFDQNAAGKIGGTATNIGNGTWGELIEIVVKAQKYATYYEANSDVTNLYLIDHSDESTSGETHIQTMYCSNNSSDSARRWKAYAPETARKIEFRYTRPDNNSDVYWGYTDNAGDPKYQQIRPTTCYTYLMDGPNDTSSKGYGYWEGTGETYLVNYDKNNSSSTGGKDPYAYIYKSSVQEWMSAWHGTKMTKTDDEFNGLPIYKVTFPISSRYEHVTFNNNNGSSTIQKPGVNENMELRHFVYYDWANNRWLDDAGGTIVDAEETTSAETGSMSGYNTSTNYIIKVGSTEIPVKTNSSGNDYKAKLIFSANETKHITIQLKEGQYPNFGVGSSGVGPYSLPYVNNSIRVSSAQSNSFGLTAATAGNYILTFEIGRINNGIPDELLITSILAES